MSCLDTQKLLGMDLCEPLKQMGYCLLILYITIIIFIVLAIEACRAVVPTKIEREFYVSAYGGDDGEGTRQKPFLTLNRAIEASRLAGKYIARKIILRNGNYFDVHVSLVPNDSGLAIVAENGENPVLYGGIRIVNWQKDKDGLWVADIPSNIKVNESDIRVLIVNGQSRPRAQIPNKGKFSHLSSFKVDLKTNAAGGTSDGVWNRKPSKEELTTMIYQAGDLGPWIDLNNAEFLIYHMWDASIVKAKTLNEQTRTVIFEKPLMAPAGSFGIKDYIVFNVRQGIIDPGQWYLDHTTGKIFYKCLPNEQMTEVIINVPTQSSVFRLTGSETNGLKDVKLDGLTIEGTTTASIVGGWGAEPVEGAITADFIEDCQFVNLRIKNVGGHGLKFSNSTELLVNNCDFANIGACGINLRGVHDSSITNNHIHNIGCLYPSGIGINMVRTAESLISGNEINDTSYTAICCDKSDSVKLEYNLIYNYMKDLKDGGAIYLTDAKKITVTQNAVKGSSGDFSYAHKYYISAYYFDEKTEESILEKNLALNTSLPSNNHLSKGCFIRNNFFVDDGPILMKFTGCKDFSFERNIIYSKSIITMQAAPEAIRAMARNIFFSATNQMEIFEMSSDQIKEAKQLVLKDGTIIANPQFIDADKENFNFYPQSPATELGIEAVDFSHAGRKYER